MDSQPKSQLRVQDRISELPDAVLCHILDFLGPENAKCAVRTSVLSKRWKNLWAIAPNVILDSEDFSSSDDFIAFVDRLLRFRESSTIRKMHLSFYRCSAENFSRVGAWIRTAVRCNLVELNLYVYNDGHEVFELPESLVTCKTLMALKLRSGFVINMTTSVCFPSLKFLYLTVRSSMDFSPFPALDHLVIDAQLAEDGSYFKISLSELKTLKISSMYVYSVYINAPKLETLDLQGSTLSHYILENTKSLVGANISLYHKEEDIGYEEEEGYEEDAAVRVSNLWTNLLEGISSVKHLSLSSHIGDGEDCLVPTFDNLSKLTVALNSRFLHSCCYPWDILMVLLDRSSNLECLVLELHSELWLEQVDSIEAERYIDQCIYQDVTWSPPESVPKCVSSCLKSVIVGLQGKKHLLGHLDEMEVLKYLLRNGQALKEMIIYTKYEEPELYSEFSRFEWGSETCQLKIINIGLF